MLEACQALAAQASVDLAVLVLAALDSVDPVVLVAAHPALVALVSVALVSVALVSVDLVDLVDLALVVLVAAHPALVALAVRASVDLSVHVVLISKSGSIPRVGSSPRRPPSGSPRL